MTSDDQEIEAAVVDAIRAILDTECRDEADYSRSSRNVADVVDLTAAQAGALRAFARRCGIDLPDYPFDRCAVCGHHRHYHERTYVYPREFWDQWEGKRLPREVLLNELPKLRRAPGPIRCSPHHSPTGPLPTVGAGDVLDPYPEPDYDAGCDCAEFQPPQEDAG